MRTNSQPARDRGLQRFFWSDRRGATAVVFTIALAMLVPAGVGLFDVYIATQQRAKLQDALDAATLYAARSNSQTSAVIDAAGDKALAANLQLISGASLMSSSFTLNGSKVDAVAQVRLPAFAPAAFSHQPITVNSEVQRGLDKLEVALVLDNTGSMVLNGSTKLATLKTQANILIDKLVAGAAGSSDPTPLRLALVPFSNTVRVQGNTSVASYNTASHTGPGIPAWVDGRSQSHWLGGAGRAEIFQTNQTDRFTMLKNLGATWGQTWAGCVETRMQPYDVSEAPPSGSTPDTLFVPYFWPDEPDSNSPGGSAFNDYIKDKLTTNFNLREIGEGKYTNPVTRHLGTFSSLGMTYNYGPNAGCVLQPVIRLTTDSASVKTAITNMTAIGETDIPLGLAWGWHVLTPNAPFADGLPYNTPHLKKIVILMTDGENTNYDSGDANASHYGGVGFVWQKLTGLTSAMSSTQRTAILDGRLAQLCTNMKAQNIEIYTIRVEFASGDPTLLRNCATSPDKFFEVSDVSALGAAFDAIAADITNLRIAH
jgi:Flp pilus assembly protein TadG